MTIKLDYTGNIDWWRTDSYWNSAATEFGSTYGTGVRLSTAYLAKADNNAAAADTHFGKTFVFAYGDGSGVQFNHLNWNYSFPTADNSKGTTGNALVSAPSSFKNAKPNRVSDNMCLSSHLNLVGTTDTSGLGDTIT